MASESLSAQYNTAIPLPFHLPPSIGSGGGEGRF
jgi:hypothetical protein